MHAAPDSSPDLFHAIPVVIVDPFTYIEAGGRRAATVSVLDADKVTALGIEVLDTYALGRDELISQGLSRDAVDEEIALRACRELGVERALVPPTFPLAVADHLRAGGIELIPDAEHFVDRRRSKTGAQLDGIRRAQRAADASMAVAADMIRAGGTTVRGRPRRHAGGQRGARLRAARRRDRRGRRRRAPPGTTPARASCGPARRSWSTSGRATRRRAAGRT